MDHKDAQEQHYQDVIEEIDGKTVHTRLYRQDFQASPKSRAMKKRKMEDCQIDFGSDEVVKESTEQTFQPMISHRS